MKQKMALGIETREAEEVEKEFADCTAESTDALATRGVPELHSLVHRAAGDHRTVEVENRLTDLAFVAD